jgi:hypothetical protein
MGKMLDEERREEEGRAGGDLDVYKRVPIIDPGHSSSPNCSSLPIP